MDPESTRPIDWAEYDHDGAWRGPACEPPDPAVLTDDEFKALSEAMGWRDNQPIPGIDVLNSADSEVQ